MAVVPGAARLCQPREGIHCCVCSAAVLLLAETLKKLVLFIPKTLALKRLFRPTRPLGDLGGPWGREVRPGSVGLGLWTESGCSWCCCYLDPHGTWDVA